MDQELVTAVLVADGTRFDAGGLRHVFEDATALAARDLRVVLVARPDFDLASAAAEAGVVFVPMALRHRFDIASIRRLASLLRRQRAGVVHAHGPTSRAISWGAVRLSPRTALLVDRATTLPPTRLELTLLRSRRVARVVAPCEAVASAVMTSAPRRAPRVVIVPPGLDVARAAQGSREAERLRAGLGVPAEAALVGQIGLQVWQGWKELLQAYAALRRELPGTHLALAGCSSQRQCQLVLRLAAETGMRNTVHALPPRTRPDDVLAACDVVVDASWAGTGISWPLMEAMALGRPIAATAVGGTPELLAGGGCGLLVPPRDTATLAAAIARLLRDPDLALGLGTAAAARIAEAYPLAGRAEALERLYRAVICER